MLTAVRLPFASVPRARIMYVCPGLTVDGLIGPLNELSAPGQLAVDHAMVGGEFTVTVQVIVGEVAPKLSVAHAVNVAVDVSDVGLFEI